MLTDLADAARASGLPVVEEPGWRTRGHGGLAGPPQAIICHHTAGPTTGDAPSLRVVRDGRPDLAGPLAHLVLARSGTVHVVAAGLCWHAGATFQPWQSNAHAIGIEAEATGRDPWPDVQYKAYVRLCRALADHYDVPYARVLGHKEVASPAGRKIDPNFGMDAFRAAIADDGGAAPDTAPAAAALPTLRRGDTGPAVAALQRFLNAEPWRPPLPVLKPDGIFGPATVAVVRSAQEQCGVTGPDADGEIVGPRTNAAFASRGYGR